MKKPFYLSLAILFFLLLLSCGKENVLENKEEVTHTPIVFKSFLSSGDLFRATGTEWEPSDEVGLFVVESGSSLSAENIVDDNNNLPFVTETGDGIFVARDKKIYYPDADNAVDIIAYYPYKSDFDDYNYPIDITSQSDVFYSNNLTGVQIEAPGNNELHFKRALSRVSLTITSGTEGASLDGLQVIAESVVTKGGLSLSDGAIIPDPASKMDIPLEVVGASMQKTATVILLPDNDEDVAFRLSVGNKKFSWKFTKTLEKGKIYRYSIRLDGLDPDANPSSAYMEIPVYSSGSTAPNSVAALHMVGDKSWLNQSYTGSYDQTIRNYSVLYDTENRVPYWVAYPLHPAYMASGNRTDAWDYDPYIPKNVQPNLYSGWNSKYLNRGHLLASADRNATSDINKTTFYFSNIAPQDAEMNSGVWVDLEERVRYWSKQTSTYDTLYVVTGCIMPKAPETMVYVEDNDGDKTLVPRYFYKALLRKKKVDGSYSSIAFKIENMDSDLPYNDSRNVFSVSELEKETGFTFFPNLPEDVAEEVKRNKSLAAAGWN